MSLYKNILLALIIITALFLLGARGEIAMLFIMISIVVLLLVFSVVWRLLQRKKSHLAEEVKKRTITWWWMVAVFMLAVAFNRLVSFVFLGFLCFAALREYFSLIPMSAEIVGSKTLSFKDRYSILVCFLSIPLMIYLAYIKWYDLFILVIPVYLFLLVPIIFVLQNRTEGSIKSLGIITIGIMFFVYNLGHSLFMINIGPILIMYCFVLTEIRDLLSYWIGKYFSSLASNLSEGKTKHLLECKVAKDVSPNKTWATGLFVAVIVALLSLIFVPIMPQFPYGRLSFGYSLVVGFSIGIFGLFGDLVFSMVKRDLKSKDTGTILPGHGGIIDRVDSLVFTIPITFHLIFWMYF